MDNVREKLVELLESINAYAEENLGFDKASGGELIDFHGAEYIADHLIANGVTVQEWIPVSDPPKERGNYLCYFMFEPWTPNVVYENTYLGNGLWLSEMDSVTHWMPLPLRRKESERG